MKEITYQVETRLLKDGTRYAVGHALATLEEPCIVTDGDVVFYDLCASEDQAKSYCEYLVEMGIVESAFLIGKQGYKRNKGSDSRDD